MGSTERAPRRGGKRPGAGRKPSADYIERAAADPGGATDLLLRALPNTTLAFLHEEAQEEGVSVQEWIRRLLRRREIEHFIV